MMRLCFAVAAFVAVAAVQGGDLAMALTINARETGARGDGVSDDSAAIQKALDVAAEGGEVFLPAGRYRLEKGVVVPPGVTLRGTWQAPHHAEYRKGTILLAYAGKGSETGDPLIRLSPNSCIRGVTIYYPEQRIPGTVPYPWAIQGEGMHGSVIDVTLVNPYKGIDFGEKPNELHYIRNVFGCPLKAGIHIDKCTDIGRIENVHFNPHYWQRSGEEKIPEWQALLDYLFQNCVAFSIGRSDWEFMHNTFSYGCRVGYHFYRSEAGACNGNFLGIAADWSQTCILVEETQAPGLLITNGEFVGGKGSQVVVDIRDSHTGVVQFSNCAFWGPHEIVARTAGKGFLSMTQCNFVNWDASGKKVPCIDAAGGEISITNSFFREDRLQIRLGEGVRSAIITGNRFAGEARIENASKGDVQIGLNAVSK
ncbi:MAG: glycosyl hydrolase family 28-related protein [Armatimonadota bacterium]|jgi:hypothetical protein